MLFSSVECEAPKTVFINALLSYSLVRTVYILSDFGTLWHCYICWKYNLYTTERKIHY
jgi:hypothetical protein